MSVFVKSERDIVLKCGGLTDLLYINNLEMGELWSTFFVSASITNGIDAIKTGGIAMHELM